MGLTERAVESANKRVTEVLCLEVSKEENKEWVVCSDRDRASIGMYAVKMVTLQPLFT